jgi:hypothetical protein
MMNEILDHLQAHHPRSVYQGREKSSEALDSLVILISKVIKYSNHEKLNDENIIIQVLQQLPVFIPFLNSYARLIHVVLDLICLVDDIKRTRIVSVFREWTLVSMESFLSSSLKSCVLNVCRQDWKSNSPFSKGRRITPGLLTGIGSLNRLYSYLFKNDSVSGELNYLSLEVKDALLSCTGTYIETILITYWGLQPSRIRLEQWRNDLIYLLFHTLDLLKQLLETVIDREESHCNEFPELANNLFSKCILLYYQLYILSENDSSILISFSDNLLLNENDSPPLQQKSTTDITEMISSLLSTFYSKINFSVRPMKKLGIFPSIGMTVFGQEEFNKNESAIKYITENHGNFFVVSRIMHFDQLTGSHLVRIPLFLEMSKLLETQPSLARQLNLNNSFQTIQFFIKRRSEFLDSAFPTLTATQEETKQNLSRYLEDTQVKSHHRP